MDFFRRKPKFKISIKASFTSVETSIEFIKKAGEVFKDADLEVSIYR